MCSSVFSPLFFPRNELICRLDTRSIGNGADKAIVFENLVMINNTVDAPNPGLNFVSNFVEEFVRFFFCAILSRLLMSLLPTIDICA
jgi:hypothetical protein